eukprot:TRINITY_DN70663_c0_g1_i1.p1 TRINITY_DN70663_c0_g1~~TRINITY_DN70663_c0_g1_i1.p1  ORF type:complete len:456 (+),score=119.77 TRINITY_DN70663_c0_g1_i1:136-1503(+)
MTLQTVSAVISQIFILSPRGDKLVYRDYRGDVFRNSDEVFFRRYKFWDGSATLDAPPFFVVDGVNFIYIKKGHLIFVCTTRFNASPAFFAEALHRLAKVLKDYLGVMTEDALRLNNILVYELLDEVIEFGYVTELSTEKLKTYIFNEPAHVDVGAPSQLESLKKRIQRGQFTSHTKHSSDALRSVIASSSGKGRKNEIFVDILEKINAAFDGTGRLITSEVDGSLIMKSFLAGSPDLKLGLNEDLTVGRGTRGGVVLDDCNFHECVNYAEFETDRTLRFRPPDGEFVVMNYRITSPDVPMPFRVYPHVKEAGPYRIDVLLRVRADIPPNVSGSQVVVKFTAPKTTTNVTVECGVNAVGQTSEYRSSDRLVAWGIKRFVGGTEHNCRVRISLSQPATAATKKEIGPITLHFEVPMHNSSGMAIRFLKIDDKGRGAAAPARWVRAITQANSYMCRMY